MTDSDVEPSVAPLRSNTGVVVSGARYIATSQVLTLATQIGTSEVTIAPT